MNRKRKEKKRKAKWPTTQIEAASFYPDINKTSDIFPQQGASKRKSSAAHRVQRGYCFQMGCDTDMTVESLYSVSHFPPRQVNSSINKRISAIFVKTARLE